MFLFWHSGADLKAQVSTAATGMATAAVSNSVTADSVHVHQTAEGVAVASQAISPFGLCLDALRVGLTGKVLAEVGFVELPMRLAENTGCDAPPRPNNGCL
jgi:hypothetical protein